MPQIILSAPVQPSRPAFSHSLTPSQRHALAQVVDANRDSFNPATSMLRTPFSSPGYHTTLTSGTVHRARESLIYAVALLDTELPENHATAACIFSKVLSLQDTDPKSRTYGIWPWFLEEPLSQMAPPDWNWADFCGAQLLEAILTRRHLLPWDLAVAMDAAIVHAARSIERRNVSPDYTNIAIMGSFVTLSAAETYEIPDLRDYALKRLRRFFAYTQKQGAFTEYNSPNYTIVALNELLRLCRYTLNPEAREIASTLYDLAWEEIERHFHAPSGQWAGPHSRSYQTFLPGNVGSLLREATGGRFSFPETKPTLAEERQRMPHLCPARFEKAFLKLEKPTTSRLAFLPGNPGLVGTTHLDRAFTIGSINHGDLWNQRRPLQAYWGTPVAPRSFRPRFLLDGYDFSAAQFFSAQNGGKVLAGVAFATDGGNTHIHLDPLREGKVIARDLRLRFEFEGGVNTGPAPADLAAPVIIQNAEITFTLAVVFAKWGAASCCWQAGGENGKTWLEVVFYTGESREFNLSEMNEAALAFAVQISGKDETQPVFALPECVRQPHSINLAWEGLHLALRTKPATIQKLRDHFTSTR